MRIRIWEWILTLLLNNFSLLRRCHDRSALSVGLGAADTPAVWLAGYKSRRIIHAVVELMVKWRGEGRGVGETVLDQKRDRAARAFPFSATRSSKLDF